jgi:hypothetical protein
MAEHTPGPWRVTDEINRVSGGEVIRPSRGDGVDSPVAFVCDFNGYDRDEERQANARLIAAAPELLEALKLLLNLRSTTPLPQRMASAAMVVAKADGRVP